MSLGLGETETTISFLLEVHLLRHCTLPTATSELNGIAALLVAGKGKIMVGGAKILMTATPMIPAGGLPEGLPPLDPCPYVPRTGAGRDRVWIAGLLGRAR